MTAPRESAAELPSVPPEAFLARHRSVGCYFGDTWLQPPVGSCARPRPTMMRSCNSMPRSRTPERDVRQDHTLSGQIVGALARRNEMLPSAALAGVRNAGYREGCPGIGF